MSSLSSWPFSEVIFTLSTKIMPCRFEEVMKWWKRYLKSSKCLETTFRATSCAGIRHKIPVWDPVNQQKLEDLIVRWSSFWVHTLGGSELRKTTWDVNNPVNSGRNYQPQLVRRILAINSIMKYDAWMCQCEVSVFCIQGKPRDVIPESCLVNKTDPQYDHLHQNKMCVFFCNGNHPNFIPNSKITDS